MIYGSNFKLLWFNPYICKPSPSYGSKACSADPEQTPHIAVSDQELHCLLTESSINIWKKYHPTPLGIKLEMDCSN